MKFYDILHVSGKLHKKKKISLHEYKMKIAIALQKEKSHQKTEELRLKALELKLKGEELRLKEMEMNKINYLTNIEEEKLKCFRDISLYLKEYVEHFTILEIFYWMLYLCESLALLNIRQDINNKIIHGTSPSNHTIFQSITIYFQIRGTIKKWECEVP